jgi:pimeloyl-ACP methyl ester carboxylesterase/DNA-binding CsgD family transcriptional regulator
MNQQIRFCTTADHVRLAYAISGSGPPLVKAGHWLTHIERDWSSPVWRHWMEFLSAEHTLVRYDERGSGLSDRGFPRLSLDDWVSDLETVVDAAGLERFTLLGMSQGGPIAIAYAARHPERVSRLVLYGTYARGRLHRAGGSQAEEEADALVTLTRSGWGRANPAFRRLFTTLFIPGASDEQIAWLDDLQQASTSAEHAARSRQVRYTVDVTALASALTTRTLVMHSRSDALVPLEEGRHLSSLIPGSRFVSLESSNHILLEEEPAWEEFRTELRAFLPVRDPRPEAGIEAGIDALTDRERHVLALVADGHDNASIASALHLSVRTVERHLSNCYVKLGLTGKAARAAAAARFATHSQT